jgi:DNA-binding CsgD family transcriptional regulator
VASAEAAHKGGPSAWEAEAWILAGMAKAWFAEDGTAEVRRGLLIAVESGDPAAIGHAHVFLVDLLVLQGRHLEALSLAEDGIVLADRLGVASTHGSDLRGNAALLLTDAGRWSEADAVLEPADPRALASFARAMLAIRRGDFAAADEALAATTVGGSVGGRGLRGGPFELARAELAWLRGDRAAAIREIESVTFSPGIWGLDFAAWRALWRARLGVDAGDEPRPRHPNPTLDRALEAEIAAETEGGDPARWGRAVDAWSALGWPYHEAMARLRQAETAFAARDRDAGRFALDETIRIGDELGSAPVCERAEDLARRSRIVARPTRRAVADPSELTSREDEVLTLLADGRTNRQIAETLFLSAKTVEIHVSRILDKLGASTRGEAVAIARRTGQLAVAD